MRRTPLSAALGCLLVIPTALVFNSCTPSVALKDYPDSWAKLASSNCSKLQGTYLNMGTTDDGTAVSLSRLLRQHGINLAYRAPEIVKLRFDRTGGLQVELWADGLLYNRGEPREGPRWECTSAGVRFHRKPPKGDETFQYYNLYLLPSTDGALIIRRVDHKWIALAPAWWESRKRSWMRFPSAE